MSASISHNHAFVWALGADAPTFLNGQFSNDVLALDDGATQLGAFCSPKGRALALAHLTRRGDALILRTDASIVDSLLDTLRRYVMRADVRFDGDAPPPADLVPGADTWQRRVELGLPRVTALTSGQFVPQMLNLDLLDGIDFAKGCYTGQEIVARTHNLGTIKRRMLGYRVGDANALAPGMHVVSERGEKIGQLVDAANDSVLAVLRLARIDEPLRIEEAGVPLGERFDLPYAIPELDDAPS